MIIAGLQKLTLLDYPGKTAATVFTPGCRFRCPFCHNAELVLGRRPEAAEEPGLLQPFTALDAEQDLFPSIPMEEVFSFLDKRQGLLDGVCITGGEPLLQSGIADFCEHVKAKGFAIKLDTNGSFPGKLRALCEAELVDYVAMDVKNALPRYAETIGIPHFDARPIQESVDFLLAGTIDYEFRTTVVLEFHTRADLLALAEWIKGAQAWFLQSFLDAPGVLAGSGTLHAWKEEDLQALLPELQAITPNVQLRGI